MREWITVFSLNGSKILYILLQQIAKYILNVYYPFRIGIIWRLIITAFLCANLLCGCAGFHAKTKGVYHRVKGGETLWSIARAYNIKIQELAEANNITDPNLIVLDSVLFIPDANEVVDDVISSVGEIAVPAKPVKPEQREETPPVLKPVKEKPPAQVVPSKNEILSTRDVAEGSAKGSPNTVQKEVPAKKKPPQVLAVTEPPKLEIREKVDQRTNGVDASKIKFDKERFIWPVKGKVRTKFGIQPNGMYYNGIRIAAKEDSSVVASASGIVMFSGSLKGYGETIIIKHQENYATVYTNLNNRYVKEGDLVKKGSRIAVLGKSQKRGEVILSFEIRHKNKARNPLFFLP